MRSFAARIALALSLVLAMPTAASALQPPGKAFDTGAASISVVTTDDRPAVAVTPARGLRVDANAARIIVPDDLPSKWSFLGDAGEVRYQLPGAGAGGLPTLDLLAAASPSTADASIDVQISGPGQVTAFTGGGDNTAMTRIVDTAERAVSVVDVKAGERLRPTWVFTKPGAYRFTLTPRDGSVVGTSTTYDVDLVTSENASGAAPQSAPARDLATAQVEPCFSASIPDDAVTVDDGHFDFGVQVEGGALLSRVKDDRADPPVWRQPSRTIFRIDETAALTVPDNPAFSFLGEAGATVWGIGQTQADGIPWLGWNTQHPSAVEAIDKGTQWTLDSVDGPGHLFVYQTGSFGSLTKVFGTASDWPRATTIPANTHAHGTWSFTEPGVYHVTTTHRATLKSGGIVTSQETVTFLVGPCASAPPQPTDSLSSDSLLSDAELVDGNRGSVTVAPAAAVAGDTVTVSMSSASEGAWYMPVFYSNPQQTEWKAATAASTLPGIVVPDLPAGTHKIAVHDTAGSLIGWAPLTVTATEATPVPNAPTPDSDASKPATAPDPSDDTDGSHDSDDSPSVPGASVPGVGSRGLGASAAAPCVPSGGGSGRGGGTGTGGGDDGSAGGSTGGGAGGSSGSTVSTGHFDFGSQIESQTLKPRVKDDRTQPPKWVDPSSVTFALGAKAEQKIPASSAYSFLGAAGSTVWLIPQTQVDGVPWLGWNTQDESVRSQVKSNVTFTLDSVSGPGKLGVYLTDSFGGVGEKKFGNMAGFPSSFTVPLNVHAHGNWAFTAAGTYRVTMTQSATLTSGQKVSAPATLTFTVGGPAVGASSYLEGGRSFGGSVMAAATVPSAAAAATPAPGASTSAPNAAVPQGAAPTGTSCTLPSAGAPDILWAVGAGLLLLALGLAATAASVVSPRRDLP